MMGQRCEGQSSSEVWFLHTFCGISCPPCVFKHISCCQVPTCMDGQGQAHGTDSPGASGAHLQGVVMTATAKGTEVALMTRNWRLGRRGFGRGPAELTPCGWDLQVFSTFNTKHALNHKVHTLQDAECPENVSIVMWGQWGRQRQCRL